MKSFFLEDLTNYDAARRTLSDRLPHWVDPWLLKDEADDAVAYFTIEQGHSGALTIQVDLSGRHHDKAVEVIALLHSLRSALGGKVSDDDGNVL